MKKIILLLALALGVEVKGQIVGGFMPQNSTKSFTAGNATFSNVIARGTLSVGSAGTVTGNAYLGQSSANTTTLGGVSMGYNTSSGIMHFGKYSATSNAIWGYHSSTPTTSNYNLNFDANNAYFNSPNALFLVTNGTIRASYGTSTSYNTLPLRIGSNSAPTATLDVTGDAKVSSTFSLGSANLTGGNTGTVAVLSDVLIPYDFKCASAINPANATTYYFSNVNQPTWYTSTSANSILMPYNATLIGYHINYIVNGTLGSSENATLQITASGSSTNILTSLTFSDYANSYTSSATSINVSAGNLISARLNTPTWGTPPTNIRMGITFLFVRRS